jgi:hypothetical protein
MGRRFTLAAAAAGPVGWVLLAVALLLPGAPVRTDQSVTEIARLLATHRLVFGLSTFLAGLGLLAICIFVGSLYQFMAEDNRRLAGLGAAVAAVSGVVFIVVGMSALGGLTLNPGSSTPAELAVIRAAADTSNIIIGLAKFAFAAMIVCVIAGTPNIMGTTMRVTGAVAAALLLGSGLPPLLAAGGIGQFGGSVDLAGSGLALLWILALSVVVTARVRLDNTPIAVGERAASVPP